MRAQNHHPEGALWGEQRGRRDMITEKQAKAAAKWWADQLRGVAPLDNGDASETGTMTYVLAAMLQDVEKAKQDGAGIDRFEAELAGIIMTQQPRQIGVDYHPDYCLAQAAAAAGLPLGMSTLPWKTQMIFEGDAVKVACGYGANFIEIA